MAAKAAKRSAAPRTASRGGPPERIAVENVHFPGRTRNVDRVKYEAARKALLKVLPRRAPGLTQAELFRAMRREVDQRVFPGGEKAGWWGKTVQLDLEAKGVIVRDATRPLTWRKA